MAVRDAASLLVGLLLLCHTWGAWADVDVTMEDRVEVLRGDTAYITCLFTSPEGMGGLFIHWFYVTRSGEKERIYYEDSTSRIVDRGTQFTDRISVNVTGATGQVMLTIDDVQLKDELEFICLIKSLTEGAGEGRTKLKVFEPPELPTIEGVQTGISISEDPSKIGTCEVKNGYPRPSITWYKNNMPLRSSQDVVITHSITTESSDLFSVTSELSMKVEKANKDDVFYCEINYVVPGQTLMTETNRINITVLYPSTAVSVWVESPKGKIKEGDSIELHCQGNGNTQSSLVTMKHEESSMSWDNRTVVLSNVTRLNSGVYQCTETDTDTFEEVTGNTTVFINYLDAAVVLPKDTVVVGQGEELKATCNALSSLQTHTVWFKDGEKVSKSHNLILKDATFDTAGTYVCVVTVPEIEGMETRGTLLVNVEGPPEIKGSRHTDMKANSDNTVDLKCYARGFPAPSVTWTTSDGKVLNTASQKETKEGVESKVSFKVTSDITAFCNVSNEYGADVVTFNIKAPIYTTIPATTTISSTTVKLETPIPPKKIRKETSGVIIAVIIICILLLAVLGSVLYFLYKKGKICGRSGKQDLTKEKSNKDNIVVEMKSDNTEEAVLLGVNGEKQPPNDQ